ncbi:hypothetical protein FF011L_40910 [Roseimaritima multifibrata]|uniref:DUF58 domain-containing protein n=1 Tax=Roseimaritima multifibrata TaxID=1930274 RepID=A0A517MK97_9BACT|nr:DUF58 domain-containing protein [Roseimaritima multifibrata]QDS95298.1 hypothetical protein FF011L_40910 [Roseimaritima multifibrata]
MITNRISRLGVHICFIALFAVLGGSLRGFNLLLIVAGLLFGTLIIQWRLARRIGEKLTVRQRSLPDVFADEPFTVRYSLKNESRWLPAWLIELIVPITPASKTSTTPVLKGRCGVGLLSAQASQEPHFHCVIHRRGRYHLGPASAVTRFPFGFTTSTTTDPQTTQEIYVYPRQLALRPRWDELLAAQNRGLKTTSNRAGMNEGNFYGLRGWQHGDSRRWIHWRTTARLDTLAVRQFEQQRRHEYCLILDTSVDPDADDSEKTQTEKFEHTLSLTSTLLLRLTQLPSNRVSLIIAGATVESLQVTNARLAIQQAMRRLAESQPLRKKADTTAANLFPAILAGMELSGKNTPSLVISSRPKDPQRLVPQEGTGWHGAQDISWLQADGPLASLLIAEEKTDAST